MIFIYSPTLSYSILPAQYKQELEKMDKVYQHDKLFNVERKAMQLQRQLKDMCTLQAQQYRARILFNHKINVKQHERRKFKDKQLDTELEAAENDMIAFQKAEKANLEQILKNEEKKLETTYRRQVNVIELKHKKNTVAAQK